MPRVKSPNTELQQLLKLTLSDFKEEILRAASLAVSGNGEVKEASTASIQETIAQTMTLSDLTGRRRVFLESDAAPVPDPVDAFSASPLVPAGVTFSQAIADLLSREPRLAQSAEEVGKVYQLHGFALARSTSEEITARVQKAIAALIDQGTALPTAVQVITEIEPWAESYAETVFRTNAATAYTAGRFQQAQNPDVAAVMPALEVIGPDDADTRRGRKVDGLENHKAAIGLIAQTQDTIWETVSPPFGYNCRHGVRLVSRMELRRKGLLTPEGGVKRFLPAGFSAFRPHPNFARGRPDRAIYGGRIV